MAAHPRVEEFAWKSADARRDDSGRLQDVVTDSSRVAVQYSLPRSLPEWELPEVPVPESPEHDEIADRLEHLLLAWLARSGRGGTVRRNLAIRWDVQNPRVGVDPDVCWIDSPPPGFFEGELDSLRLWLPGHRVPPLAIEIVSRSHPYKDYGRVQRSTRSSGCRSSGSTTRDGSARGASAARSSRVLALEAERRRRS